MGLREDIKEDAIRERLDEGSMFNPFNRYENYVEEVNKKQPLKDDGDPKVIKDN